MNRIGLSVSAATLAAIAGLALWVDRATPADARIALHYGLDGEPTRYGPKSEAVLALWILLGVGVFLTALLWALSKADPRRDNLQRSNATFQFVWASAMIVLGVVAGFMAASFTGFAAHDGDVFLRVVFGLLGVLVLVLGNGLGKVRPNFTLGVRTPWTLTSDIAWEKTHRFAGWLMVIWGLVQIGAAATAPPPWAIGVAALGGLIVALAAIAASYLYWRDAPDRRASV